MDELIKLFDLHRCSKSGAKFDYKKGIWFNHQYIQQKPNEEIAELFGILQDQPPVRRLLCVYGRVGAKLLKNGHKNLRKNQPNRSCMSAGRVNMERSVESMTPEDASS